MSSKQHRLCTEVEVEAACQLFDDIVALCKGKDIDIISVALLRASSFAFLASRSPSKSFDRFKELSHYCFSEAEEEAQSGEGK